MQQAHACTYARARPDPHLRLLPSSQSRSKCRGSNRRRTLICHKVQMSVNERYFLGPRGVDHTPARSPRGWLRARIATGTPHQQKEGGETQGCSD